MQHDTQRYQALVEYSSDWIWEVDAQGSYTFAGPQVQDMLGYSSEEIVGKTPFDLMSPEEGQRVGGIFQKLLSEREPVVKLINKALHRDGHEVVLETSGVPIVDDAGELQGYWGIDRDITSQKVIEEKLRLNSSYFRRMQKISAAGIWDYNLETEEIYWSEEVYRFFETPADFVPIVENAISFFLPEYQTLIQHSMERTITTKKPYDVEVEVCTAKGNHRWCRSIGEAVYHNDTPIRIFGTFQDITARKQAEEALRLSKQKLALHVQQTPMAVIEWDIHFNIIEWNPAAEKIFGFNRSEVIGKHSAGLIIPASAKAQLNQVMTELVQNKGGLTSQNENLTKDGRTIICEWFNTSLIDENNDVVGVASLAQDITERIQTEDALRRSEMQFSAFMSNIPGPAYLKDESGRFKYINSAFQTAMHQVSSDIVGKTVEELFDPQHAKVMVELDQKVQTSGQAVTDEETTSIDGEMRNWLVTKFPVVVTPDEPGLIGGVAVEITDRKKAEQEREKLILELEDKNDELERFTYTVSHDLKSPLVTVSGFIGMLVDDIKNQRTDDINEDIREIKSAIEKMKRLMDELLELSRIGRQNNPMSVVSISQLANEAISLLTGKIETVGATIDVQRDMPSISCDRPRIYEVVQNLMDNALKYMGDQPQPRIEIGMRTEAQDIIYFVRDNGIGIELAYHKKVFGIFDQLNQMVEGTGVGLAIVKRIIEVNHGNIWVESDGEGKGSTFCFTLPQNNTEETTKG
jgi:PAS domain S-box-containing protein